MKSVRRFRLKGPGYSACIERFRIAKEAFNRQKAKGEPTALSGHEKTERAETEHDEKTREVADREWEEQERAQREWDDNEVA
ncbi:hypothetical protein DAPPUDRAFT_250789 [Daphnia pulex]|uniref:Uncharacterized protein n=1 Tax=Daphnia pulex TaxID=6669 RepID=E9GZA3_DAPPU|nr:hypothetical protein DAPPUDRAFT_250789 [Daphnia pulex]|eukprot:EFX75193.1 hypothetical protein DAPPUDRAFT_250789 [Daphnia pulex]